MVQNQKLFGANFEPYLDHFFAILEEFSTFFYPLLNGQMRKLIFRTRIGLLKSVVELRSLGIPRRCCTTRREIFEGQFKGFETTFSTKPAKMHLTSFWVSAS